MNVHTFTVHLHDLPAKSLLEAAQMYLAEPLAGWQEPVEWDGTTAVLHRPAATLTITAD